MQTASVAVQTLCVPCFNRCRYCLLSWDGTLPGADYARSERYAQRFHQWIRENRPELSFQFYFGFSMEHPQLADAVDFMNSIGSAGGQFLQLDGLAFREDAGIRAYLSDAKAHGIRAVNLTFYGLRDYHDRFAGRRGDFDYLMAILRTARALELEVSVGIPLTRENAPQAEELRSILTDAGVDPRFFVPHSEGRGITLEPIRLRQQDLERCSPEVLARFNARMYRTEAQWLHTDPLPLPERRMLAVSLTEDNIGFFETFPFEDTIRYLEQRDDAYHGQFPPVQELMALYGDPDSELLYSFRDLCQRYMRRHLADHPSGIPDVTDERGCFSRRY